jgi:hypothetical protein
MGMVPQVPPLGKGEVPEMGRWPGLAKCRGWGHGAGAEDGELWRGQVSMYAADRVSGSRHAAERHVGRARGGRRPLRPEDPRVRMASMMYGDPRLTVPEICRTLRISSATFYRYVALGRRVTDHTSCNGGLSN